MLNINEVSLRKPTQVYVYMLEFRIIMKVTYVVYDDRNISKIYVQQNKALASVFLLMFLYLARDLTVSPWSFCYSNHPLCLNLFVP